MALLSRACGTDTERTYKMYRELRKAMPHLLTELWFVTVERWHAVD